MSRYIDSEKLIAEIERRLHFDNNWIEGDKRRQKRTSGVSSAYYKRIGSKHACESLLDFVISLQQEQPEVDLEKEEFVGVAESPLKTFPRVNDFECGGSYRH